MNLSYSIHTKVQPSAARRFLHELAVLSNRTREQKNRGGTGRNNPSFFDDGGRRLSSRAYLHHDGGFHLLDVAGGYDGLRQGYSLRPHGRERVRHLPGRNQKGSIWVRSHTYIFTCGGNLHQPNTWTWGGEQAGGNQHSTAQHSTANARLTGPKTETGHTKTKDRRGTRPVLHARPHIT